MYKEIFEKPVKEKIDELTKLTYEIHVDYLTYYFTGNSIKKRFDDFNNGVELF